MSKTKKIIVIIAVISILCSIFIIPVSAVEIADTVDFFEVFQPSVNVYLFDGDNRTQNVTGMVDFTYTDNSLSMTVLSREAFARTSWIEVAFSFYFKEPYSDYGYSSGNFKIDIDDDWITFSNSESNHNFARRVDNELDYLNCPVSFMNNPSGVGRFFVVNVPENSVKNSFDILEMGFVVTTQEPFNVGTVINFDFFDLDYHFVTADGKNTQAIIQNQNDNTDKIISNQDSNASEIMQNQNENTDKILNGDTDLDSSGQTGKVDGTIGGIDGATSNALGGKTEEEIQQEVEGALDTDKIGLDFTKASRISNFFDDTLSAFGSSYKTLLMLSLCLGLAAFLIGRRYG